MTYANSTSAMLEKQRTREFCDLRFPFPKLDHEARNAEQLNRLEATTSTRRSRSKIWSMNES